MDKEQFLDQLERSLKNLPETEIREILEDYRMHFREGAAEGRDEEKIARMLGNPVDIGRMFRADFMVEQAEQSATFRNVAGAIMAVIGLGFFNILFVVGPVLGIFIVLSVAWLFTLLLAILSLTVIVIAIIYLLFPSGFFVGGMFSISPVLGAVFLGIGGLSLSGILGIGMGLLTRFCFRLLTTYLKFNLEMIQKRRIS